MIYFNVLFKMMLLFVFIFTGTPIAITEVVQNGSSCGNNMWQCLDANCVHVDRICDGTTDCPDESDETNHFCGRISSVKSDGCVLPPYPLHGTYTVLQDSNARPGQSRDFFELTVSCRRGFGIVDTNGGNGTLQVACLNGKWYQSMPKCVRFCKLDPDPSVRYLCHLPGGGFKECKDYVAPGTSVNPDCNRPLYYSTESLPYMQCTSGYWNYIASCKADCGRVNPKGEQLVIGGIPAERGELPWHVGIYRKTTRPYMQICGGSIVTNNVVISAAHCFWTDVAKLLPSSNFAVAAGKLHRPWDSEGDIGAQKSDVKQIHVPRLFAGAAANFQEDIAILILTAPFVYKTYIRPVCLNYDYFFDKLQLQHDSLGKVAGWGLTSANGEASQVLKVVDLPYVNEGTCISNVPESFREYITGDKFCAGYTNGIALCKGDSGGGIAFPDKELGVDRHYLRGIVSAAPTTDGKACNDNAYTTFTKITKHQDFIKEVIAASNKNSCPLYSFQCDDGSCVEPGADCNGKQECTDGSDEAVKLCGVGADLNREALKPSCVLPPYPDHGTYIVMNEPDARPGQAFDSVTITVVCWGQYTADGMEAKNPEVICVNGEWDRNLPKCVLKSSKPEYQTNQNYNRTQVIEDGAEPKPNIPPVASSYNPAATTRRLEDRQPSFQPYSECGILLGGNERPPLLINENSYTRGDLPWVVAIYLKKDSTLTFLGAGTLISDRHIISSAVFVRQRNKINSVKNVVVRLGAYRLFDWADEFVRDKALISASIHESYNETTLANDISVLTMTKRVEFNDYIRPACLWTGDTNQSLIYGSIGIFAGWGDQREGEGAPKMLRMPIVSTAFCRSETAQFKYITSDKTLCAGDRNGVGPCLGDGGGGLYLLEGGRWRLRGMLSIALRHDNSSCNLFDFFVFTDTAQYLNWIKRILSENYYD